MPVKPEDDFHGYMEAEEQAAQNYLDQQARLERHRLWRETTWGGFAVRQVQVVGDHFQPFFSAIAEAMTNDTSVASIAVRILIRLVVVFFGVGMCYLGASLLQKLIGTEYEIVEEVVVVEGGEGEEAKKEK